MMSLDLDVALRAYVPPWEPISKPLPPKITLTNISKARKATGLDWEPHTEPQYRRMRHDGLPGSGHAFEEVPEHKYVTKGSGGPILDSAHADYHLFSNQEVFEIAEAVGTAALSIGRDVRFVAGGELAGGKRVFLLADLGVTELPGDPSPHVRYMGMLSSHDGTAALKVFGTNMRWSCTNMIRAAELDARQAGVAFSFRHSSRIAARVAKSQQAITATLLQHDAIEQTSRELLAQRITAGQASEFISQYALARVISKSAKPDAAADNPRRLNATMFAEGELRQILASPTCAGITGNAYGLLAAAVEFNDHRREVKSADAYFTRTMVARERGKNLAIDVLRSVL